MILKTQVASSRSRNLEYGTRAAFAVLRMSVVSGAISSVWSPDMIRHVGAARSERLG